MQIIHSLVAEGLPSTCEPLRLGPSYENTKNIFYCGPVRYKCTDAPRLMSGYVLKTHHKLEITEASRALGPHSRLNTTVEPPTPVESTPG